MEALAAVGPGDAYWALRQTLVSSRDELDAFDRVFAGVPPPGREVRLVAGPVVVERAAASAEERLREKDFAELSAGERARLPELVAGIAAARPLRRSRRLRPHRRGDRLDLRRLARRSLATGGDPVARAFRRRVETPRRLVLLCDLSASMEPYARPLLLFADALLEAGRRVEAFGFGTRLTRLPAPAPARDWGGGTRIGSCLKAYNDAHAARGAVVVIASDGFERDDLERVARETARLARGAYAVVWVNPLKGRPGYEPSAGGMRAALPFVDRFLPGHNLESLEELAAVLGGIERRHAA